MYLRSLAVVCHRRFSRWSWRYGSVIVLMSSLLMVEMTHKIPTKHHHDKPAISLEHIHRDEMKLLMRFLSTGR